MFKPKISLESIQHIPAVETPADQYQVYDPVEHAELETELQRQEERCEAALVAAHAMAEITGEFPVQDMPGAAGAYAREEKALTESMERLLEITTGIRLEAQGLQAGTEGIAEFAGRVKDVLARAFERLLELLREFGRMIDRALDFDRWRSNAQKKAAKEGAAAAHEAKEAGKTTPAPEQRSGAVVADHSQQASSHALDGYVHIGNKAAVLTKNNRVLEGAELVSAMPEYRRTMQRLVDGFLKYDQSLKAALVTMTSDLKSERHRQELAGLIATSPLRSPSSNSEMIRNTLGKLRTKDAARKMRLYEERLPFGGLSIYRVGAFQHCSAYSTDFKTFIAPSRGGQPGAIPDSLVALTLDEVIALYREIGEWVTYYSDIKAEHLTHLRRDVNQAIANVRSALSGAGKSDGKSHIALLLELVAAVEASVRVSFVAIPSYDARVTDALLTYANKSTRIAS